jgi:hypothetical protein
MSDRKEQLEREGPIRAEGGADGSYGIGWKSSTRPDNNVLDPESTPRSELTTHIELGECVKDGVQHKRLWVRVSCDGAIGELHDDEPVTAFHDDEHAISWAHYMITYLNCYLPERLRTMALLTVREAIAKSSELHGLAEIDWKLLAESHGNIVAKKIKQTHVVRSGPDRLFKTKQQYLNFLEDAARTCKSRGERLTQEWAAEFANGKFSTERGIDERMIRKWNRYFRVDWNWYADKVNRTN